jgi:uroporphyrinogen-III synthase
MSALAGQTVLITRSDDDCMGWADALAAAGATPVVLPCIRCETLATDELRERIDAELPHTDWLVFTSKRGVTAFTALCKRPVPDSVKVAVIGPATADTAVIAFGRADLTSESGTAVSLAQALEARFSDTGARLLVAIAENAGTTIEDTLRAAGATCTRLDVYRTLAAEPREPKQALSVLGADNIFLASPSAVTGLTNQVELDKPAAIFTIGPATNEAAEAAGLTVAGQATSPGLEGLMEAMRCAT